MPLTVAEKSVATQLGAQGEIPYKLTPGAEYEYADLSGPHGIFATLDYSETPQAVVACDHGAVPVLSRPCPPCLD